MDKLDLILILIFLMFVYFTWQINSLKEKFGDTAPSTDAITTAVKQVYLADVEAIRLLSQFAIQLVQQ